MKNWEKALATALQRQWKHYRKALKRCQIDFAEPSIHASRIEARRLAAQLDLLRPFAPRSAINKAHHCIKHHLNTFDPLRDAHVQTAILKRECARLKGVRLLGRILAKRERKSQRAAERRIHKIDAQPARAAVKTLVKRLRRRGKNLAMRRRDRGIILHSVETAFAKVVYCRHRMSAANPNTIHRTRIAFKRFRYMLEALQLLLPRMTRHRLNTMKAFQDLLGELQDTEVFLARVDKLVIKKRIEPAEVAPVREWLVRRHQRQVNRCLRRAEVIFKFWPLNWNRVEV